jgi:hypothetical protein
MYELRQNGRGPDGRRVEGEHQSRLARGGMVLRDFAAGVEVL